MNKLALIAILASTACAPIDDSVDEDAGSGVEVASVAQPFLSGTCGWYDSNPRPTRSANGNQRTFALLAATAMDSGTDFPSPSENYRYSARDNGTGVTMVYAYPRQPGGPWYMAGNPAVVGACNGGVRKMVYNVKKCWGHDPILCQAGATSWTGNGNPNGYFSYADFTFSMWCGTDAWRDAVVRVKTLSPVTEWQTVADTSNFDTPSNWDAVCRCNGGGGPACMNQVFTP